MTKKHITWLTNSVDWPGGIERVICNVSNFLHDSGYEIKIVSLNTKSGSMPFPLNKGITVEHLAYPLTDNLNRKKLKATIKSFLQKEDSDILITCHPWIAAPVIQSRKSYNGKIICTEHAAWNSHSKARRAMNVIYYRRADHLVLLTKNAQKTYQKYGLKNTAVIPNFITDLPAHSSKLQSREIIAAGRLLPIKGYDRLIEAIAKIKDDFLPWHLTIYGDGDDEAKLKQLITENNLQKQISIQKFTDKLSSKLRDSSCFIIPSHDESFSLVAIEAMSYGVPVISFDIPALREIDNRSNTIIFAEQDNINDLAAKIRSYIQDSDRASRGKASRKLSENYTLDKIGQKWIKLISS